jgi:hypothetical protein
MTPDMKPVHFGVVSTVTFIDRDCVADDLAVVLDGSAEHGTFKASDVFVGRRRSSVRETPRPARPPAHRMR